MDRFKALADERRREILSYIKKNPNAVCCDIAKHINKDVSTTFRHLITLEKTDLIATRKEGKFLRCRLKNIKKLESLFKLAEVSL